MVNYVVKRGGIGGVWRRGGGAPEAVVGRLMGRPLPRSAGLSRAGRRALKGAGAELGRCHGAHFDPADGPVSDLSDVPHAVACEAVLLHCARAKLREAVRYPAGDRLAPVHLVVRAHRQRLLATLDVRRDTRAKRVGLHAVACSVGERHEGQLLGREVDARRRLRGGGRRPGALGYVAALHRA